jgi:hypothetical protein
VIFYFLFYLRFINRVEYTDCFTYPSSRHEDLLILFIFRAGASIGLKPAGDARGGDNINTNNTNNNNAGAPLRLKPGSLGQ